MDSNMKYLQYKYINTCIYVFISFYVQSIEGDGGLQVGDTYLCPDWSQELMPLATFLDCHLASGGGRTGGVRYLAQHPLFDQVR